jgi:hypothetical protein
MSAGRHADQTIGSPRHAETQSGTRDLLQNAHKRPRSREAAATVDGLCLAYRPVMHRRIFAASIVALASAAACGGVALDVGDAGDAGNGRDAAAADSGADARGAVDAAHPDAQIAQDAAQVDAGAEEDAGPNDPRCPSSLDADASGHCAIGLTCNYAEGHCECTGYCGGPPPPPDAGDLSYWYCAAWRTDGCPRIEPKRGSACAKPGQTCSYGSCCTELFTCDAGAWSGSGPICPP